MIGELIGFGIVAFIVAWIAFAMFLLDERNDVTKRWIERRWRRWWLGRTKRDRRPKAKKLRAVMDPSAGYRGGVPRIEEER